MLNLFYSNLTVYAYMMPLCGMCIVLVIGILGQVEFRLHQVCQVIFQYNRRYSVTSMLQEIGLPTFSASINKYRAIKQ